MLWHSFAVVITLSFFASVAFFSSFKVIVLAFTALPSTIWELEIVNLLNNSLSWLFANELRWLERGEGWGKRLVERLKTSGTSCHLSKLIDFSNSWLLNGLLNLLKWWEVKGLGYSLWEEFLGSLVLLFERVVSTVVV